MYKFGSVRPILNKWHPNTKKITYWFPSLFSLGIAVSLIALIFKIALPIYLVLLYFAFSFIVALFKTKKLAVSILAIIAILIQFFGYGYGFLKSTVKLQFSNKSTEKLFPNLFFKAIK